MIAQRKSGWLLPAALLVLCLGLAWVVSRGLQADPQPPASGGGAAAPAIQALPRDSDFAMAPVTTFAAIVERPIFSPTRRPPPEGTETIDAPEPELQVTLIGVVISAEEQIAIFAPRDGTEFFRLSEGDLLQGWTLETIEPDRVTFRRGDVEEQIELTYDRPPPVKRPRRERRRSRQEQNKKP